MALFAWLLWGDFCFTIMEAVVPSIIPLKLQSLGASNSLIALMMSTLPGIFNTTVCPWVSFKSDSHRGRFGRRLPFIIYSMPFLVISLIFIGLSSQIGGWLHDVLLSGGTITRTMVIIGVLGFFLAMFDLFNMFVASVFSCLFNDVVPRQFIGSFMGWARLVGVLSTAIYQYFIFKFALSHMTEIYLGAALLYLVGFGTMCFMVKEGEYPPPETVENPGLLKDIKLFARNCYTIPYYWNIFLDTTFTSVANSSLIFVVFFQKSMGLDLDQIGKLNATILVLMAACLPFAGMLVDRFNPVRTQAYLLAFQLGVLLFNCVWIFAMAPAPWVFFWMFVGVSAVGALATACGQAAALPRFMVLFPTERFGQFCGAQALVRSAAVMLGGLLAGVYIDVIKSFFSPDDLKAYRYIYLWMLVFFAVAYFFHYRAYRYWRRLGGESSTAPLTPFKYTDLPEAASTGVKWKFLIIPFIAFCGYLGASLFFIYYFKYTVPNAFNVAVFSGLAVLLGCFFLGYLRFVRFLERP